MRLTRIHTPQPLAVGALIDLDGMSANHAIRVLRMQVGQPLTVFNGSGGEYHGTIDRVGRGTLSLRIDAFVEQEAESPLSITLVQAISKGERMDYTVQKAVELGVHAIVPVFSARAVVQLKGERLDRRTSHWQAVAVSACEQCGRNRVPDVQPPLPLNTWLANIGSVANAFMMDPESSRALSDFTPACDQAMVLSGPEGGFTAQEADAARQAGFVGVRLGPRVLRTETAAIAMLAALQTLWGDFRTG